MKRLTLNETWKLCLSMWRWIARQIKKGSTRCVASLKEQWLREHGFSGRDVWATCFFCEYGKQVKQVKKVGDSYCSNCPARLVSSRFHCSNKTYSYDRKPIAFYNKLISLNKKRKKK